MYFFDKLMNPFKKSNKPTLTPPTVTTTAKPRDISTKKRRIIETQHPYPFKFLTN